VNVPTVFVEGKYRYYFFSREEERRHVHVSSPDGEAKVWLEPEIAVARVINLNSKEVNEILETIKNRKEEINADWTKHFETK
jgi:CRISPR/Cas system CSM-associated protein Csm2 small subunit